MITNASTDMSAAMQAAYTLMTANDVLKLFFGAGIILFGFTVFKVAKRAVRR